MRNRLRLALLCCLASFLSYGPANAQTFDGNGYLEMCSSSDLGVQNGCDGVGFGMVTALLFWNSVSVEQGGPATKFKFCLPAGVGTAQAVDIVHAYVEGHPATRHYPAGMLAELALLEAFPC